VKRSNLFFNKFDKPFLLINLINYTEYNVVTTIKRRRKEGWNPP